MSSHTPNLSIVQSQKQKQVLSQKLISTYAMVKMPYQELAEKIKTELETNPFIEEEEKWISGLERSFAKAVTSKKPPQDKYKSSLGQSISDFAVYEPTMYTKLKNQLDLIFPPKSLEYTIGLEIISSLDENGYFSKQQKNILLKQKKITPFFLDRVLANIRLFQPTGIASENLQECLLSQIEDLEIWNKQEMKLEKSLIKKHLKLLNIQNVKRLSEITGYSQEEIRNTIKTISHLNPKPASEFNKFQVQIAIPEGKIWIVENELMVTVNDNMFPNLKIKQDFSKKKFSNEEKKFSNNIQELNNAIAFRKKSLRKILESIAKYQKSFFFNGWKDLKPMTMTQISNIIHVDISIISRSIYGKFIETPQGLLAIRSLFSSGKIAKKGQTERVSQNHVYDLIVKILEQQKVSGKKITDEMISNLLQSHGYQISRRTVNKYRNVLKKAQILTI